ncbi:MAG: hypothetical protein OEY79_00425 [Anaplasmataceae bacterium]|nr:hypothetical protein [Anaplasmataceae bacterium]
MTKKIAFVLSGCGYENGSELYETIFSIEIFKKHNCEITFFAPNIIENDRNPFIESKAITRGEDRLLELNELIEYIKDFDVLFFPGGFGVVKNLSNYMDNNIDIKLYDGLKDSIIYAYKNNKTIGALCIAPTLLAVALGGIDSQIILTLGGSQHANKILKFGMQYKECKCDFFVKYKNIYTSPAFMASKNIIEIKTGIEKMINEIVKE